MLAKRLTWPYCHCTSRRMLKHDQKKAIKILHKICRKKILEKVDRKVHRVAWRFLFHSLYRTKNWRAVSPRDPVDLNHLSFSSFFFFFFNNRVIQNRPQSTPYIWIHTKFETSVCIILLNSFWLGREDRSRMLLLLWRIYPSLASWHQP